MFRSIAGLRALLRRCLEISAPGGRMAARLILFALARPSKGQGFDYCAPPSTGRKPPSAPCSPCAAKAGYRAVEGIALGVQLALGFRRCSPAPHLRGLLNTDVAFERARDNEALWGLVD
jgi:hypothetical protein